ncbi:MAG: DUF192 domain-containing protein [Pseudomonadota bacterium]
MPTPHFSRRNALAATLCALLAAAPPAQAQDAPQKLPTMRLNAGFHNIQAEVARSPQQRATGLMHRSAMGANDGMLFVFEQAEPQCFWMKNTLLPLTIAFLADDGTIVNLADMEPRALESHCSAKPVRLALEMNAGWFAKRGLKAGSRLGGPAFQR